MMTNRKTIRVHTTITSVNEPHAAAPIYCMPGAWVLVGLRVGVRGWLALEVFAGRHC